MKLSKEHIKFIDDYLKEQEVVFWDIRLELIDHVASKLEENQDLVLNRTFLIKEFGTRISIVKLSAEKMKLINKKYRRLYFKELILLFKSPVKVLLIMLFVFSYYFILSEFSTEIFKYTSCVLLYFPMVIWAVFSVINKNPPASASGIGVFIVLPMVLLQLYMLDIGFGAIFNYEFFVFVLMSLSTIWSFNGFNLYVKTYKKYLST